MAARPKPGLPDRVEVKGFDWDRGNIEKCQRHGVLISDIEGMFARAIAVFPDPAHSASEVRFKAIGRTESGRSLLVVFTLRQEGRSKSIRPISARHMHRKEIEYYEKEAATARKR